MRIVLTGAAGLLGRHLLGELSADHELVPVDRDEVDHPGARRIDLAQLDELTDACEGAQALVHLAASASERSPWEAVRDANLIGVYHAFEAARRAGVERVLFASSNHAVGGYEVEAGVAAYRGAFVLDARSAPRPDGLYGASKLFGEALGRLYADAHGLRVLCLRIGAVVDGDDLEAAARGEHGALVGLSSYEDRLERVRAMWLSRRDLAQLVRRGLVADYRFAIVSGVSGNRHRFLDLEEARRVLGYAPEDGA